MFRSLALAGVALAVCVGAASAQSAGEVQEEVLGQPAAQSATPAGTAEWQVFSRSSQTAFLADPSSIAAAGGVTSIRMARAPLAPSDGEAAWTLETYEFRCSANQYRTTSMADFAADGSAAGPQEALDEAFDAVSENGLSGYLKGIACDDLRTPPPHYPTIQAWIAGGRK